MLEAITSTYTTILHFIAEVTISTLDVIGIFIIIVGSFRAIMQTLIRLKKKQPINIMIELGRSLALALEFKMGAEIVNTVIVRDLAELAILAVVIALRTILALLIHWEIKNERRDEAELAATEKKSSEQDQH
jgi:uncharacterized membrane protein